MNLLKFYQKRIALISTAGVVSEMALLVVGIMFLANPILWFSTMILIVFIGILYIRLLIINANKLKEVKNDLRTMPTPE